MLEPPSISLKISGGRYADADRQPVTVQFNRLMAGIWSGYNLQPG